MTTVPVGQPASPDTPTPAERLAAAMTILRRRWLLATVIVLLTATTGYVFAAHAAKHYTARAQVVVGTTGVVQGVALGGPNSGGQTDLERQANTDLALVKLRTIASEVRDRLHLTISARALLSQVTASYVGDSNIVGITAEDSNPTRAAAIANAFATEYQAFRRDAERTKLRTALDSARARLINLGPSGIDTPFGRLLQASINRLQVALLLDPGTVTIAQYASAPSGYANRRPTVVAFVAFLVGCVFAALVLALLERVDDRLHDEQEVAQAFRRPAMARLVVGRSARGTADEHRTFVRLAARILGTRGERFVLLVGSPTDNPATARVTLGLGAALSHAGKRVIAIDARARPPRGVDADVGTSSGLAAVLEGHTFFENELRTLLPDEPFGNPSFEILAAGRLTEGHELVANGERLQRVLQQAARRADVVLIAAPPLLQGADAISLLPAADAVLVIAEIGETTGAEAAETLELLDETDAALLGVVATRGGRRSGAVGFDAPAALAAAASTRTASEPPPAAEASRIS